MALPARPNGINSRRKLKSITGATQWFIIEDEIVIPQGDGTKLIYFQKLRWEHDGSIEYRLTYYIIGEKPGRKGQWVSGQFSAILPAEALSRVLDEARRRHWDGI